MYPALEKVKSTVVPVLWFEEGIDELGNYNKKYLKKKTNYRRSNAYETHSLTHSLTHSHYL